MKIGRFDEEYDRKDDKDFEHNGNSGTLVVFMAGQIRIERVGIAGVGPLGVSSRTEVIEDKLYWVHWTDS